MAAKEIHLGNKKEADYKDRWGGVIWEESEKTGLGPGHIKPYRPY